MSEWICTDPDSLQHSKQLGRRFGLLTEFRENGVI